MSSATVTVSYVNGTLSFSPDNGDVTVDFGTGNTITFNQKTGETGWKFTGFSVTPNPQGMFSSSVAEAA